MHKLAHFIDDHGWSLLTDFQNPKTWIDRIKFRPLGGTHLSLENQNAEADPWLPVDDHDAVLGNSITLSDGRHIDLKRFVFTTDSGLGKSCALDWLQAGLNRPAIARAPGGDGSRGTRPQTGWLAFNVPRSVLSDGVSTQVHNRLRQYMRDSIKNAAERDGCTDALAARMVERHRQNRQLLLLFDGLDHLNNADALAEILRAEIWRDCHIGIGGRPFALNRYWDLLFNDPAWRFLRIDPFTVPQQKLYLGDKYDQIPAEAREAHDILSVPRVIQYLNELTEMELQHIKTAADVFYGAIKSLIISGLDGSEEACKIAADEGSPPSSASNEGIDKAFHLLSAIAFEMAATKIQQAVKDPQTGDISGYRSFPNFYKVPTGQMSPFKERIKQLTGRQNFDRAWNALAALNNRVLNGIFDDQVQGLKEVEFANRSLQEFLCAYYLSQHCGRKLNPVKAGEPPIDGGANDFLRDWIYLPFEPETHDYYEIWLYLCEMSQEAINPHVWLESIAPLYSPARPVTDDSTNTTKWVSKRSNEMIFRSWLRLGAFREHYPRAHEIRQQWSHEFEQQILAGNRGEVAREAASMLKNDFLEMPSGTVCMGLPDDKRGGLDEDLRKLFESIIQEASQAANAESLVREKFKNWNFGVGKSAESQRQAVENFTLQVINEGGMPLVEQQFQRGKDEHWHKVEIDQPFQLCRRPCTNDWYRLYASEHGTESLVAQDYEKYSKRLDSPAIYISFFDAWAFCQWARWDGRSCQLPWEDQWEYACKFGTDPQWLFWWESDEFRDDLANANGRHTTAADPNHANPNTKANTIDPQGIGLMDMLGNVFEWCQDPYEEFHAKTRELHLDNATGFRVGRGGSFFNDSDLCRSACRVSRQPSVASLEFGFRVSRAVPLP